jgi:hypothetical protein
LGDRTDGVDVAAVEEVFHHDDVPRLAVVLKLVPTPWEQSQHTTDDTTNLMMRRARH